MTNSIATLIVLYVNNCGEHFADLILQGLKSIESRTNAAAARFMASGVQAGQIIGIAYGGKLRGLVTFQGLRGYLDAADFYGDLAAHLVGPGSRYAYDTSKGKTGLILSDPARLAEPVPVHMTCGRTYTTLNVDAKLLEVAAC